MKNLIILFLFLGIAFISNAQTPNYQYEPVVMTGQDVDLSLCIPDQVHAYKRDGDNWVKIPFQIDERVELSWLHPYDAPGYPNTVPDSCFPGAINQALAQTKKTTYYCDPNTNIGADSDPFIDHDDELVFMYKDAGQPVNLNSVSPPSEVTSAGLQKCVEVELFDHVNGVESYVYLFVVQDSISTQTADYISYTFNNNNINCDTRIGFEDTETSLVTANDPTAPGSYYTYGFSRTWVDDELTIGSSQDILDRRKFFIHPISCGRTEETASEGENAFIANIDGDVRAIRSFMGANSGAFTQRTQIFYQQKHETETNYRVHAFPEFVEGVYGGGYDVFDFNTNMIAGQAFYEGTLSDNVNASGGYYFDVSTNRTQKINLPSSQGSGQIYANMSYDYDEPSSDFYFKEYYNDTGLNGQDASCEGDEDLSRISTIGMGLEFRAPICTDETHNTPCQTERFITMIRENHYLNHSADQQDDVNYALEKELSVSTTIHCESADLCSNGVLDPGEIDIDCGGPDCDSCGCPEINFENFDNGWGDWIDGGLRTRRTASSPAGNFEVEIRNSTNNSHVSYVFQQDFDYVNVEFDYRTENYSTPFRLQTKKPNGTWQTIQTFDPSNGSTLLDVVSVNTGEIDANDKIRFRGRQPSEEGRLYLDNITLKGCSTSSPKLGKAQSRELNLFSVSPLPASDVIYFKSNATLSMPADVVLYDMNGKRALSNVFASTRESETLSISVAHLTSGIYILNINSGNKVEQHKVLVLH